MTTENNKQEHLGELSRDFAVFLPAISNFYNTFISKQRVSEGKHIAEERIPKTFEQTLEKKKDTLKNADVGKPDLHVEFATDIDLQKHNQQ